MSQMSNLDKIYNYVNNMFLNVPKTPQVERLKQNISDAMEDKFVELLSKGKNTNEALGIVFSEFGDMREIYQEIGISTENGFQVSQPIYPSKQTKSVYHYLPFMIVAGFLTCVMGIGVFFGFQLTTKENTAVTNIEQAQIQSGESVLLYGDNAIWDFEQTEESAVDFGIVYELQEDFAKAEQPVGEESSVEIDFQEKALYEGELEAITFQRGE